MRLDVNHLSLDYHEKYFQPPMDERTFIYPEARAKLFYNLVENYKVYFPNLKIIYAALNFDSKLKVDYLLIFYANIDDQSMVLWDAPFMYTNRSIPSYRYAVKNNLHEEFFRECSFHFCKVKQDKFLEYITSDYCENLSTKVGDPKYWKLPENSHSLISGMADLSLQYRPTGYRNPNRPKDNA